MHERENETGTTRDRLALESAPLRLGPTETSAQVVRTWRADRCAARVDRTSSRSVGQFETNQKQSIILEKEN